MNVKKIIKQRRIKKSAKGKKDKKKSTQLKEELSGRLKKKGFIVDLTALIVANNLLEMSADYEKQMKDNKFINQIEGKSKTQEKEFSQDEIVQVNQDFQGRLIKASLESASQFILVEAVKMVGSTIGHSLMGVFGPTAILSSLVGIVATGMEMAYMIREAKRSEDRLKLQAHPTQRLIEFNQVNQMSCANILNSLNMITNHHNQLILDIQLSGVADSNEKIKDMNTLYNDFKDEMIKYCDNYSNFQF